MFKLTRLLYLPADTSAPDRHTITQTLRDASAQSPMVKRYILEPTLPGVLNGGDFIWHLQFADEAAYRACLAQPAWREKVDPLFDGGTFRKYESVAYQGGLSGGRPVKLSRGVYRTLIMTVKPGTSLQAIAQFDKELAGMPRYISSIKNWQLSHATEASGSRQWSHIWEQGFADMETMLDYLKTPDGVATSGLEGFMRAGAKLGGLRVFTCPFQLNPVQSPPVISLDPFPVLYALTARTALGDADTYVDLLERYYDRFMTENGAKLLHRWRTVDRGYGEAEVQSTWSIDSLPAYGEMRFKTYADKAWNTFVAKALPLVTGGTRRFYPAG